MTTTYARRAAAMAAALLATTLAAFTLPASAQTQFTTGAIEARAFLARSSTQVYAAGYGAGLHVSNDAGLNWSRTALPGNMRYLTALAGNGTFFVVAGDEGLLVTTNGTSFTQRIFDPVSSVAVNGTTTVLAGVPGVGIMRSTDSGATFGPANNTGFDSLDIVSVAFAPDNTTAYAVAKPDGTGARGGVFRSTDGGATWANYNSNLSGADKFMTSVVVDSGGTAHVSVLRICNVGGCDTNGVVWSRASGAGTWTAASNLFGVVSLHRDLNTGTKIWAGSKGLGLLSGSAGASYSFEIPNNGGSPSFFYTAVTAVTSMPSGSQVMLMALKGAGVWRSAATGSPRAWTRISFPGADRVLSAANVPGGGGSILAGLQAGGIWRSNSSLTVWTPPTVTAAQADFSFGADATAVNAFVSIWDIAASASNPNLVYVAAGGVGMPHANDSPGIFRWNGTAWQGVGNNAPAGGPWNGLVEAGSLTLPSAQVYGVSFNAADENAVYGSFLATSYGVMLRNAGSWTIRTATAAVPQVRRVLPTADAGYPLALPFDDKPVRSNGTFGADFTQQVSVSQAGFERIRFYDAAINPGNINNWVAATNKGVFYSMDNGHSWTRPPMAGVFQQSAVSAIGYKGNGNAFAADFAGNRYCSNNGGVTWVSAGAPLRAGVNAIRTIGGVLYYLTDGAGFFREDGTC